MNYENDDKKMRSFTRSVTGSGSEYRVDGKVIIHKFVNQSFLVLIRHFIFWIIKKNLIKIVIKLFKAGNSATIQP